jgi:hypothetical protein
MLCTALSNVVTKLWYCLQHHCSHLLLQALVVGHKRFNCDCLHSRAASYSILTMLPDLLADSLPGALLCIVHRAESLDGYIGKLADKGGWLVAATDWRGLSRYDLPNVARMLMAEPGTVANFKHLQFSFQAIAVESSCTDRTACSYACV